MFMLERMRAARASGCADPSLPRALEAMDTLATITADPTFLSNDVTVDAYLTAFGDALRYVYIEMVSPFVPTTAQLHAMHMPSGNAAPSSRVFVFGLCTHTLKIKWDRRASKGHGTPSERMFRLLAKEHPQVTTGILCLAAFFDDDLAPDLIDAAITVGIELDPAHPLFYLARARRVPVSERVHWARRGLDVSAGVSPFYTLVFSACIDPAGVDMALYRRCVRPWVPAFVDRAILRPVFRGQGGSVDIEAFSEVFTCDVCDTFALHLRRGACSKACQRRRRCLDTSPKRSRGACLALTMAVASHSCASCGGKRYACYCAAADALANVKR